MTLVFAIIIILFLLFIYNRQQYKEYVLTNSTALKEIEKINAKYQFLSIPNLDLYQRYDNVTHYDSVSELDYLTYQLTYDAKKMQKAAKDAQENARLYKDYTNEVNNCRFGVYKTPTPKNRDKLISIEKNLFFTKAKVPQTNFSVGVTISRSNMSGRIYETKYRAFSVTEINQLINRLNHKSGDFYLDEEIWQSICRVERGKVSNALRFEIYARDNYRCQKCGCTQNENYLEIDHIFPISKGGKTVRSNLQTLCRSCNGIKSNNVEYGTRNNNKKAHYSNKLCPNCNIPLVIRHGSYGDFYGCQNYPNCKFTKTID